MSLNLAQKNALNSISPAAIAAGAYLGALIDQLQSDVASGQFGIESDPWDIDNLAEAGRHVGYDADNTSALNFAYLAGAILVEGAGFVAIAADTIALSASNTNYVEAAADGSVSKNTVGFTEGRVPLFIVVTGVGSITSFISAKALLRCRPTSGLTGAVMSTAVRRKQKTILAGTLSATGTLKIPCPSVAATITRISIGVDTTISANDTNYWTFSALNKGPSGIGATALLAASDANTTKLTGGSDVTAYIERALSLSGTPGNLVTAANDVLVFTATKTASGANLAALNVTVEFDITG